MRRRALCLFVCCDGPDSGARGGRDGLHRQMPAAGPGPEGRRLGHREAQGAVTPNILQEAVQVIDRHVDGIGVSDSSVTLQGNDIVIELPGAKNDTQVLKVVGPDRPAVLPARGMHHPGLRQATTTSTTTKTPTASTRTTRPGQGQGAAQGPRRPRERARSPRSGTGAPMDAHRGGSTARVGPISRWRRGQDHGQIDQHHGQIDQHYGAPARAAPPRRRRPRPPPPRCRWASQVCNPLDRAAFLLPSPTATGRGVTPAAFDTTGCHGATAELRGLCLWPLRTAPRPR